MSTKIDESIELTPEMIAAGASVICGMSLEFYSPEGYAATIFLEMMKARALEPGLSEKPDS